MAEALFFAALAGAANLLGGFFLTSIGPHRRNPTVLLTVTAFGGGFMLAVAILEMLPEGMKAPGGLTAALAGYLAVHVTQHVLTPHFHYGEETHAEAMVSRGIGVWALVGLIPHSFFDGVAIASGFLASPKLGFVIFLAMLLHKVPTGVSLASVMLASGHSARSAVLAGGLVGLSTFLGALATPLFGPLAHYGLALSAGVTIYVAASNLIPEIQHTRAWQVPTGVVAGVVAFYLAWRLMPGG